MINALPLTIAPAPVPAAAASSYVLLVDDHEPSLRRLNELIRSSGHHAIATRSGTEALACCERRRPRVVLTDLAMPNLDGKGLALWLQTRYPSVPLILMTGQECDPAVRGDLEQLFAAILPKPIDINRLLRLLDRMMPAAIRARPQPGPGVSRP
jgi:DNA-binding NtrC family response regulator